MKEKAGSLIWRAGNKFELWRNLKNSRKEAAELTKEIVRRKGFSIMTTSFKKTMKRYCRERFGSSGFWPWIALYTEIRGKYIKGWVPDDYYKHHLAGKLTPPSIPHVSALKSFDHRLFPGFALDPLFVKIGKNYFDSDQNLLNDTSLNRLLKGYSGELVVKRDAGASGKAVEFFEVNRFNFKEHLKENNDYVVQPSVKQHPAINKIYPASINTLRVVTCIKADKTISVMVTFMRFGTGGSRLDNVINGGRFVELSDDGTATGRSFDEYGLLCSKTHPDTDYNFSSLSVPSYNRAIELCKKSHDLFPYYRLIAWDVFIDTSEIPRLLEWNRLPGLWRYEAVFGPLWGPELIKNAGTLKF